MDPVIYHAHNMLRSEDLYFWRGLVVERGFPILELGCGTGRVLCRLMKDNYDVVGIDNDPKMIAYLQHIIPPQLSSLVQIVQGDMRTFDLGVQFPLIILPCNTLSTFDARDRQQIFQQVRKHLEPQGVFVFSIPNTLVLKDLPTEGEPDLEDEFKHPATHNPIEVYSSWEKKGNAITFRWQYLHMYPDGNTIEDEHVTTHYLDLPQAYVAELRASGLIPVSAFGDFDRQPFNPDSPYFILFAGLAAAA